MSEQTAYEGWAILELMGHRRLAGYVRVTEIAGAAFLRLDVPDDPVTDIDVSSGTTTAATQFYSPQAVYCLTPTTEPSSASPPPSNGGSCPPHGSRACPRPTRLTPTTTMRTTMRRHRSDAP